MRRGFANVLAPHLTRFSPQFAEQVCLHDSQRHTRPPETTRGVADARKAPRRHQNADQSADKSAPFCVLTYLEHKIADN